VVYFLGAGHREIIEEGASNEIIAVPKQGYTTILLRAASALYSTATVRIEQETPNPPIDDETL